MDVLTAKKVLDLRAADIHPLVDRKENSSTASLIMEYAFQPCFEIK